jgi:putative FmdB family regulatory protein
MQHDRPDTKGALMPVYEYLCELHGVTELTASMGEAPESIKCPIGEEEIPRVYSAAGIHFKGTGFYSTDKKR